jgi:hypothetical protein
MVEVHLMRRKSTAAIGARDLAPLAQHRESAGLADPHPKNFSLAIASVVVDVCRPLVPFRKHGSL